MYRVILFVFLVVVIASCTTPKTEADLLIHNANVYTVDEDQPKTTAFVVTKGTFVAIGDMAILQEKYSAKTIIDVKGKTILPGLIDAHCHFYRLGLQQQKVDVTGTKSYEEVLQRIIDFQQQKKLPFITGRGWDQNDWQDKEFPSKEKLDSLFPNTPVVMERIDGHAYLVNQKALDLANITSETKVSGGAILKKNGNLTGVLVDNPMTLIDQIIPQPSKQQEIQALKDAEAINLSYGLTTVDDAGLSPKVISLIDSLQKAGDLKIRMYAMISNEPAYVEEYLQKGTYKSDLLNVRSFKVYADGALGSRGAVLKEPYADQENHFGAMVIDTVAFRKLAKRIAQSPFQMNTHAIGDSANAVVINTYYKTLLGQTNRRWRVEHAQVVAPEEMKVLDDNLIMSVQPTHGTSDMYWAEDRLGAKRMPGAYAYKKLLNLTGKLALGTDYPVEHVNPFYTFYAAVARKDLQQFPPNGFQKEDALTREETLKGMTIWAAYSNFEEQEKGSITVGKFADFVILDQDIMQIDENRIPDTKIMATYIGGERVYETK